MFRLEAVGMGIDGERVGRFGLGIAMERPRALRASGSRRWRRKVRAGELAVVCTNWSGVEGVMRSDEALCKI